MKLAKWMDDNGIKDAEFVEKLRKIGKVSRDRSSVTRWRRDETRPDWEAMFAIEKVTDGAVTAADFRTLKGRVAA